MATTSAPHAEMATPHPPLGRPTVQALPVTPGKVAMWLFLATEVMFFTGLIGSYVVLRHGSPMTSYIPIALYPPNTVLTPLKDRKGVILERVGADRDKVARVVAAATGHSEHDAEHSISWNPMVVQANLTTAQAEKLKADLVAAGASARVEGLEDNPDDVPINWPRPYDALRNPLSIDLTAVNTFILICSSVTMVLALGAIQKGNQRRGSLLLLATVLIGSVFLSVQVFEYYQLMFGHHYPVGISPNGHFRPNVSLFASCFFTMTGFHGAHVAGGVVMLACLFLQSLRGTYTATHHSSVELVGLYWHFVDLVWIILFTVVYLV